MKSSVPSRRALPILSSALSLLLVWGFANSGCTAFESADESRGDAATADDGAADGSGHSEAGTSYRDIVLVDGPRAYWRLGEAPGELVAKDETGHGFDGTYAGLGEQGIAGAIAWD